MVADGTVVVKRSLAVRWLSRDRLQSDGCREIVYSQVVVKTTVRRSSRDRLQSGGRQQARSTEPGVIYICSWVSQRISEERKETKKKD